MVAVEDFRRNKLREGRRPDAGDDVGQNGGFEEMELTIDELGMMVAVEDFRRNKLREGRRPDAGDDVEQNCGLEEMELTIDERKAKLRDSITVKFQIQRYWLGNQVII
ncbi:hypothetical protein F2Q69_00024319 [Brassica cretica]|uniref:Uncharacterized protein n=1 Tax=Brassica cretica TaxID=69181 RepID=A0A8S9QHN8_BRACR|nr:hypothetical protein F2Q69_00024319 [Brassica cretica]